MPNPPSAATRPAYFVRGDVDGFFGLFVDNLLQLMLIAVLGPLVCGFPQDLVIGRILPGAAVSILVGNVFYAWQARRLMQRTGRTDVTALPYGINTPSLFAYVFLVMGPVYQETQDARLAWQLGLFACLLSGVLEAGGAFVGDWLRRHTPRAALLAALAGIAITFLAAMFLFQIFVHPLIAVVPLLLVLVAYAARYRFPAGLPGGLVAVLVGVGLAWGLRLSGFPVFVPRAEAWTFGLYWPVPSDALALLADGRGWQYLAVILPMTLFNVVGSLQNLESAEAAGDRFETRPSLLANGAGTVVAAFLGSPFPTTIYIGHPAWKAMGARAGYSVLNGGVVTLLCLVGGMTAILSIVPIEATLGILVWIGIMITAQAFQEVPKPHALAVAFGLIPSLAAWAVQLIETSLRAAGATLHAAAPRFGGDLYVHGAIALSQGFLLTAVIFAATVVHLTERRLLRAAAWLAAAAGLSWLGVIHAYDLTSTGIRNAFGFPAAPEFAAAYALAAALLVVFHLTQRSDDA